METSVRPTLVIPTTSCLIMSIRITNQNIISIPLMYSTILLLDVRSKMVNQAAIVPLLHGPDLSRVLMSHASKPHWVRLGRNFSVQAQTKKKTRAKRVPDEKQVPPLKIIDCAHGPWILIFRIMGQLMVYGPFANDNAESESLEP